jgi:glycine/D-amino acid oxidase-like deaminating enzyme
MSSYWLSEERPALLARVDRSAGPVDVAIVGGGVTGCACALTLAERGKRVRVYKRGRLPASPAAGTALSRSAGRLQPTTSHGVASAPSERGRSGR